MKTQKKILIWLCLLILLTGMIVGLSVGVSAQEGPVFVPQSHVSEKRDNGNGTYNVNFYAYPKFYKDGSGNWQTANTDIVSSSTNPWNYEVTQNIYTAYFRSSITAGDNAKFQTTANNDLNKHQSTHSISYDQQGLSWVNDEGSSDNISNGSGTGAPSGNVFLYDDAFGTGIDFSYQVSEDMLLKKLTVASFESLPAPSSQVSSGTNPSLKFEFKFSFSSDLNVWIDGAEWDKSTGPRTFTAKTIEFKDSTYGETKFILPAPFATDSSDQTQPLQYTLQYEVKKQGNTFLISILTPYSWLQTATYPVEIDPTVTFQYGDANGELSAVEDASLNQYYPFWNTGTENPVYVESTFYKALFKFPNIFGDLSGQIPSTDVTIDSATLDLKVYNNGSTTAVFAYKLLRNWIEGTNGTINATTERGVTWDYAELYHNREGISVPWTTEGAANTTSDVSATKQDDAGTSPSSSGTVYSWTITNAVTDWKNNTSPNYGVILYQTGDNYVNFYSGEDPTSTNRPKLSVTYTDLATADSTAPNTVSNLAASTGSNYQDVNLTWTNPGDDAGAGNPTGYVIKYATAAINNATDWQNAMTYPQTLAGTAVSTTLKLPNAGTTYYFAIKGYDDSANYGGLSNTPSAAANSTVTTISRSTLLLQKGDGYTSSETDDTTLDGRFPYANNALNSGDHINSTNVKTLIKFPNFMGNDADQVYPKVTINKAYIVGWVTNGDSSNAIYAYKMLRSWDEGTQNNGVINSTGESGATWLDAETYFNREGQAVSWGTEGAANTVSDYNSTKLNATGTTPSSSSRWYEFDITNAVQDWVNRTTANYGVLLMKDSGDNWVTYDSSESTTQSQRPMLFIDYSLAGYGSDSTAPATVSTLAAATGSSIQQINLTWTAPGDDNTTGTPSGYVIRYATSAISNESGFDNATTYPQNMTPAVAGSSESLTVKMPSAGTTYYFAIKAYDEDFNFGGLSNSPSAASNNVTTTISSATLYLQKGDGNTSSETDDTYLDGRYPQNNNGTVSGVGINSTNVKSLIKFPNFTGENTDQVFPKVTINKAYLILYNTNNSSQNIYAYKMIRDWDEGNLSATIVNATGEHGATYLDAETYFNREGQAVSWGTEGAGSTVSDYNSTKLDANGTASTPSSEWHKYDITTAVQAWVNMTSANYGVLLMKDSTDDWVAYDSSESTTQAQRPLLYLDYSLTGYVGDSTAPSAISTLAAATGSTMQQMNLTWTATGDNAGTGTATGYVIKYSTSAISNETAFDSATTIPNTISPAAAGASESLTVKMPAGGTTYYFAIKAYDEDFNFGALSNSPSAASNNVTTTISSATLYLQKGDGLTSSETDDTYINKEVSVWDYGIGTGLGINSSTTNLAKSFIKFPNLMGENTDQVFPKVTINKAYLILYNTNSSPYTIYAYKMMRNWMEGTENGETLKASGESGMTWYNAEAYYNQQGENVPWGTAGAGSTASDYNSTKLDASGTAPTSSSEWYKYDITTAVQAWVNMTSANYGVLLMKDSGDNWVAYDSSESTTQSQRPLLYLDYSLTGYASDSTAPSAISTLAATTGTTYGNINLTWTATGDNAGTGTATGYVIKYSTSAISNETAFDSATTIPNTISPAAAGGSESLTVKMPAGGITYYFAIKAYDEDFNFGSLSNSPSAASNAVAATITRTTATFYKNDGQTSSETDDALIYGGATTTEYGTGTGLGVQFHATTPQRFMVKFPNFIGSGTDQVPSNVTVNNAYLILYATDNGSQIFAYKMLQDWTEGNSTGAVVDTAGEYGMTWNNAQVMGSADTTINDSDGITASDTTITIATITSGNYPTTGLVKIDNEIIKYSSIGNTSITVATNGRGWSATTAATHANSAAVAFDIAWSTVGADHTTYDRSNTQQDSNPGAPSSSYTRYDFTITSAVQDWVNGTTGNYGVIFIQPSGGDYVAFNSSENVKPVLYVDYVMKDSTAPSAVSDLSAGTATTSSINLTWTDQSDDGGSTGSGNVTSYQVKYSTSAGIYTSTQWDAATTFSQSWTVSAPGTSHTQTVSGLSADTTYYFAMKSCDEASPTVNCSSISNTVSLATSDATAPTALTTLAVSNPTTSSVGLTWTEQSDNGNQSGSGNVSSYTVKYSTSTITADNFNSATTYSQSWSAQAPNTSHPEFVSGLSADTTYYFAVKSCDEVPNCSLISNVVSTATLDTTAPSAISTLATSNVTATGVTLTWTEQSDNGDQTGTGNITSYTLKYSTSAITNDSLFNAANTYTQSWSVSAPNASHSETLSGLSSDTTYYFSLKSCDSVPNCSTISNSPASITTTDNTAPSLIGDLTVTNLTSSGFDLTWTEQSDNGAGSGTGNISSYTVKYSTSAITNNTEFTNATTYTQSWTPLSPGSTHTETISGLSADTTYYFAIKSCDSVPNCSTIASSGPSGKTTDAVAPSNISDLATGSTGGNTINVSWTEQSDNGNATGTGNITSYTVKYSTSAITASNFTAATTFNQSWEASSPGATHTETITGLAQNTTYYIAIKSCDEVPNCATISNVVNARTESGGSNKPSAIYDLATSNSGSTSMELTWTEQSENGDENALGNVSTYTVKYSTSPISSDSTFTNATTYTQTWTPLSPGTSHTETISGLSTATTYYFSIKSCNATPTCSNISNAPSGVTTDQTSPSAISDLTASLPTSASIILTWTEQSDNGNATGTGNVTSYTVKYSTSEITSDNFSAATTFTQTWVAQTPGSTHTGIVSGLSNNTRYYIAIKSCDESSNCSLVSNSPNATTTSGKPSSISDLATSNIGLTSVNLTWTEQSENGDENSSGDVTSYTVKYSTSAIVSDSDFASATTYSQTWTPLTPGTSHTETLSGLTADTAYYFAIKSCNSSECSNISNAPSATTLDQTAPSAISDLAISLPATTSIVLTWTEQSDNGNNTGTGNVTSYTVKYSTSEITSGTFDAATTFTQTWTGRTPNTSRAEVISGLTAGTTYYVAIKLCDENANCSLISNVATGSTSASGGTVTTTTTTTTGGGTSGGSGSGGSSSSSGSTSKSTSSGTSGGSESSQSTTESSSKGSGSDGSAGGNTKEEPKEETEEQEVEITESEETIQALQEELSRLKKEMEAFVEKINTVLSSVGHWAQGYITALYKKVIKVEEVAIEQGVVMSKEAYSAYEDPEEFDPNKKLNRAEVVKISLVAFGYNVTNPTITEMPFNDIEKDAWYIPYVAKAKELGIIHGYPDGSFQADRTINRAEALKIVAKAAGIDLSINMQGSGESEDELLEQFEITESPFRDVQNEWFAKYVYFSYSKGIIQGYGDGTFRPWQEVTQAEFSKIAVKTSELVGAQ